MSRWRGEYVDVDDDGARFHACAVCRQPIDDPRSVERGIGPQCWAQLSSEQRRSRRELALASDRRRWRVEQVDRDLMARIRGDVVRRDGFYWLVATGECAGPIIGWREGQA